MNQLDLYVKQLLLVLVLLILSTYQTSACSCAGIPSIQENWEEANEVFIGEVTHIDSSRNFFGSGGGQVVLGYKYFKKPKELN
jgi:hypothetical protein